MHAYAVNPSSRESTASWLGLASTLLALALGLLLQYFSVTPPWWLDTPAVLGFYAMVLTAFNKRLWKKSVLGLRLTRIPDLTGTWTGTIISSHDATKPIPVVLHIEQEWINISVRVETEGSRSFSQSVSIEASGSSMIEVDYTYLNQPKPLVAESMVPHRGAARLVLTPDLTALEGAYFSDQSRSNHGLMKLTKLSYEIIPREEALKRASQLPA